MFSPGRYLAPKRSEDATLAAESVAVLPFENLSEEKSNAYFAGGIQDEILARLSKIEDLKVISHASTQKYKSAPASFEVARPQFERTVAEAPASALRRANLGLLPAFTGPTREAIGEGPSPRSRA